MKIGNNELEIENITNNDKNVKEEAYQLSNIISPIFGRHYQKLTSTSINVKKNNRSSFAIEQDIDKKSEENIFHEKEVAYSIFDNTRIAQNKKNKAKQQRYDSLSSHYLEFREKIDKQNTFINVNNLSNNDTVITTIDLLIDDILDENK